MKFSNPLSALKSRIFVSQATNTKAINIRVDLQK